MASVQISVPASLPPANLYVHLLRSSAIGEVTAPEGFSATVSEELEVRTPNLPWAQAPATVFPTVLLLVFSIFLLLLEMTLL